MAIKTFQRSFMGRSTYNCNICGKLTRNTGDEGGVDLCRKCYDEAGLENEHSDHGHKKPIKGCPTCGLEKDAREMKLTAAKATVTPAVYGAKKGTTMSIKKDTTVFALRAKYSDYTILRLLAKRAGLKETAGKLVKRYGSAYKAARLVLARLQKPAVDGAKPNL